MHFLQIFCFLSFLLVIGVIIRGKIKAFQKLFIPSSVIGGVVGLLIGPEILGKFTSFSLSQDWIKDIGILPGILIIPVVVSVPLGFELTLKKRRKETKDILSMTTILFIVTFLQLAIGYGVHVFCKYFLKIPLYETFGAELNTGFAGGHGTAGVLGRALQDLKLDYWNISQGVAITVATFGLIGGIIFGIVGINYASRKGKTSILKDPSQIPDSLKKGFIKEKENQPVLAHETMLSSNVDTLAFHIGIILSVCGVAYICVDFVKKYKIPILSSLSVWAFGMLLMFVVNIILKKMELQWAIDKKLKTKIAALFTEFAVLSAITALPLKSVASYIIPIIIVIVLGFIFTWLVVIYLCNGYFKDNYPFERGISILGTSFGVFFTGILLLRICDPEFSSPVLGDYSLSFSLIALLGPILIISSLTLALTYGALITTIIFIILIFIGIIILKMIEKL